MIHAPAHPYTAGLLGSIPRVDRAVTTARVRLAEIDGRDEVVGPVVAYTN